MPKYRRGSGSVYRKRGRWYIAYYANGKQICEATGTKDKAEARRILQARLGQLAEGRYIGPKADRVTFKELTQGLITDYRINNKKTLAWVERRVRLHLIPFFGDSKAQEITTADVQVFIAARQEAGASNGEINREIAALKRAFNLAFQAEKITRKPYIAMLKEDNVRQGFFERAEFEAVLARLPDYLRPPITFAYQVGWRILSEILSLKWPQIDLEEGTVRLEVGTTKNKGGRLIYLPQILRGVLEAQWQEHLAHYPQCSWVFYRKGKRIPTFYKVWHKACHEAGVPGKIPHDFRRTAVRNMVRAGIPERVAMQIAGHKTRTIFDRYHIVSEGDLREAARRLEVAFNSQTTTISTTMPETEHVTH